MMGLCELQPQWVGPATEEEDRAAVLGAGSGLHVAVDERTIAVGVVEEQPYRMCAAEHELVEAGLHRHDRSTPTDRKPVRLEPLRIGPLDAEVEGDLRVDTREDQILWREPAAVKVLTPQAPLLVEGRLRAAESTEQVRDYGAVLPHRQSAELHPGGAVAVAGDG